MENAINENVTSVKECIETPAENCDILNCGQSLRQVFHILTHRIEDEKINNEIKLLKLQRDLAATKENDDKTNIQDSIIELTKYIELQTSFLNKIENKYKAEINTITLEYEKLERLRYTTEKSFSIQNTDYLSLSHT